VAAADDDCVVMLRHAVKLHTNARMKELLRLEEQDSLLAWGDWVQGVGLGRKRKRSHCSGEAHTHGADLFARSVEFYGQYASVVLKITIGSKYAQVPSESGGADQSVDN